jgi:N-acetyl-gamma-glutamyl-phosphate reductase
VVDIKTGVSGAGREATEETHYVSAADNVNPYKTEGHRHSAELDRELPGEVGITFVPHLIPVDQGLLATCYAITGADLSRDDVRELLRDAYAGEPFVDVVDSPPHTADVRHTNRARVYGTVSGERVLVETAIDNLWKGAAGQAVQSLNLMLGLPETEGLE